MNSGFSKLQPRSLVWRIFVASIILLPVLLGFSALMLDNAFRKSLFSAEKDTLLSQTYLLIGAAEPSTESLELPSALTEPRFNMPESGLYGQVVNGQGEIVWQSDSLSISPELLASIDPVNSQAGRSSFEIIPGDAIDLTAHIYGTVWEINKVDNTFYFIVALSQQQTMRALKGYRQTLWFWLGGLALLLIAVQTLIIRWGLLPLHAIADDIQAIKNGEASSLGGEYPSEIHSVTTSINHLIDSEKQQQERYKNTLSDLAHSLKTPLSVIQSTIENPSASAENTTLTATIDEQVLRMNNIVTHQLKRASASAQATYKTDAELFSIIERLGHALQKAYQSKHIVFKNLVSKNTLYRGEEDDLMEVLGNIMDNAFKYGKSEVNISADESDSILRIFVEDDGKGVAASETTEILKRGARYDTSTQGQGIGLAVAADILSSYNGGLAIEKSQLGGARFIITLPHSSASSG